MATPNSRTTFKNYCLRSLGFGVIDINVSDDQVDDRIDEALQYFAEYHYDGYERMYLKHLVTEADVTRARDNITLNDYIILSCCKVVLPICINVKSLLMLTKSNRSFPYKNMF